MAIETVQEDPRPLHMQLRDSIIDRMEDLESILYDLGPSEYVWILTQVIKEAAERIANRTGAV